MRDTFSINDEAGVTTDVSYEKSLELLFRVYEVSGLEDNVIQSLNQLMPRWSSRMTRAFKPRFASIISSVHAQNLISSATSLEYAAGSDQYIDFLMGLVEQEDLSSSEYIEESCVGMIIPIIQQLMRSDGVPNIDEEFSQRVLEHFNDIAEGYLDWEDKSTYASQMEVLLLDVCRSCMLRAKFPNQEMSSNGVWDIDERTKFRDFRMDLRDTIQTVSACISGPLMELIGATLLSTAAQNDYALFEAGLFCLRALPDANVEGGGDYDQTRQAVSESPSWQHVLNDPQSVPDKARRGVIDLLSEGPE